ncbi:transposase [Streptomyces rishiriensis]|uniref:transposase n=1 Tax=Streptomyces rishiriensis TaxID=68264 RepID=UPI00358DDA11
MSNELRSRIEPLLTDPAPKFGRGNLGCGDRQPVRGILFVLHTGIRWEYLPQELVVGSGMICWRRLAAWNEAGVRAQLSCTRCWRSCGRRTSSTGRGR